MNQEEYIEYLMRQHTNNQDSPIAKYKRLQKDAKKLGNYGDKMQEVGKILSNTNSPALAKLGGNMSKFGNSLSNASNNATNFLNKPQAVFKGFAPRPFSTLANNGALTAPATTTPVVTTPAAVGNTAVGNAVGSEVAGTAASGQAAGGAVGNAVSSAAPTAVTGETLAGTAAGTTAGTAAGTTAGTAAGTTAGGAAGAGAGGAAGGAAAGGSAAGGAAAAGPIGALVALAVMAAMGTHRKAAKKAAEQTSQGAMNQSRQAASEVLNEADAQTANNRAKLNNIIANSNVGGTTGAAAPVQPTTITDYQNYLRNQGYDENVINGVPQGLNNGNAEIDEWIKQYNAGAGQNNPINIPQTEEEIAAAKAGNFNTPVMDAQASQEENVKRGLLDKFISGISDFSRGYDENRNTAFSPNNLQRKENIADFKANINPDDYTTKLSAPEQEQFNKWVADMRANGYINPNDNFKDYDMQGYWKNEVLNNTDLANGNAQNHFTDKYKKPNHETFSNESIYAKGDNARYAGKWDANGNYIAPVENNKMAKLGEAMGTLGRFANKPVVQALVAGGLSTALTGNPLYGLGQGYKFANQRAMSNVYGDILKQYGVDVPEPGMFGNISGTDMRNIGNMAETHAWHEYLNQKNADELARKIAKDEADKEYKEKRVAAMQQNADTNEYKAKNGTKVTHVSGGSKPVVRTANGKEAVVKMEAPNGKIYLVPESQIKRYKAAGGKIVG